MVCFSRWETGWRTAVGQTPWYRLTLPVEQQTPSFELAMLPRPGMHTKSQLQPPTHYFSRHTVKTADWMTVVSRHSQMVKSFKSGAHSEKRPSVYFDYWLKTLSLEGLLLLYIRSLREGNFELVESMTQIMPWMFALDHTRYSR